MRLRLFDPGTDFETIRGWIAGERAHALWCANRFRYPLDQEDFTGVLAGTAHGAGNTPFVAVGGDGAAVGFFCYSLDKASKEGKLKFIVVAPECRGRGIAAEMLRLAADYAFGETGAESISLSVFPVNARAKRCYEKAGFAERSTVDRAFGFGDESWGRCDMVLRKGSGRPVRENGAGGGPR